SVTADIKNQMSHGIGRVPAIAKQIIKGLISLYHLVLAKSSKQIRERLFRDMELANGVCQRDEYRVSRLSLVTGVQLTFPLIEQVQRCFPISYFIAQIVGDATVGINIEEMLSQAHRQKPGRNRKVLIMCARQTPAVFLRFSFGGGPIGNCVLGRETTPPSNVLLTGLDAGN